MDISNKNPENKLLEEIELPDDLEIFEGANAYRVLAVKDVEGESKRYIRKIYAKTPKDAVDKFKKMMGPSNYDTLPRIIDTKPDTKAYRAGELEAKYGDLKKRKTRQDDEAKKLNKESEEYSERKIMEQKIKDLIDNIEIGNADAINASFSTVMAEKVSARLDSLKQEVANVVFKDKIENNEKNN